MKEVTREGVDVLSAIVEELNGIKSLILSNGDTKLMTIKDVAEYSRLSTNTVSRAVRLGTLKPFKDDGKKLFRKSYVDAWLQR